MPNLLHVLAIAAAVTLAGCTSTGQQAGPGASVEERPPGAAPGESRPVETPGVTTVTPPAAPAAADDAVLRDPKSILSKRSVYFDFDRYDIKDEYKPLVEAHARYLVATPKARMLIQGNADERGSREYNLALGQKRSDAVKRMLTLLGAREEQIESVSLGEEKPKNPGHDEAAWAENRRGDLLYGGEF
jgi:peptidoglycan-associated lipoprotein